MVNYDPWLIAPVSSIISILIGLFLFNYVNSKDAGTARMKEIAGWIHKNRVQVSRHLRCGHVLTVISIPRRQSWFNIRFWDIVLRPSRHYRYGDRCES